ncbi:hypothetical protein NLU13_4995 [Sarocladium strictum]|uniref:Uncharacterized protein n=1 Tax=Sarocladium strictum TaxID=5046 RepID=A0AA39GMK6_SARSR|nr:hypothetical protein NLU13_4995 [Sarocladium strictum]
MVHAKYVAIATILTTEAVVCLAGVVPRKPPQPSDDASDVEAQSTRTTTDAIQVSATTRQSETPQPSAEKNRGSEQAQTGSRSGTARQNEKSREQKADDQRVSPSDAKNDGKHSKDNSKKKKGSKEGAEGAWVYLTKEDAWKYFYPDTPAPGHSNPSGGQSSGNQAPKVDQPWASDNKDGEDDKDDKGDKDKEKYKPNALAEFLMGVADPPDRALDSIRATLRKAGAHDREMAKVMEMAALPGLAATPQKPSTGGHSIGVTKPGSFWTQREAFPYTDDWTWYVNWRAEAGELDLKREGGEGDEGPGERPKEEAKRDIMAGGLHKRNGTDQKAKADKVEDTDPKKDEEKPETKQPVQSKTKPEKPQPAPEKTAQPKEGDEEPEEDNEKQKENIEQPKEDIEKPKEDSEKPKENIEQPKEDSEKPKENSEKPKENSEKPKEDNEQPRPDTLQPVSPIDPENGSIHGLTAQELSDILKASGANKNAMDPNAADYKLLDPSKDTSGNVPELSFPRPVPEVPKAKPVKWPNDPSRPPTHPPGSLQEQEDAVRRRLFQTRLNRTEYEQRNWNWLRCDNRSPSAMLVPLTIEAGGLWATWQNDFRQRVFYSMNIFKCWLQAEEFYGHGYQNFFWNGQGWGDMTITLWMEDWARNPWQTKPLTGCTFEEHVLKPARETMKLFNRGKERRALYVYGCGGPYGEDWDYNEMIVQFPNEVVYLDPPKSDLVRFQGISKLPIGLSPPRAFNNEMIGFPPEFVNP